MACKNIPIEPNPRGISYVNEDYLNENFPNMTATRWSAKRPQHLKGPNQWPFIHGLNISVLDVVGSRIRPHRYQRYQSGWTRIAKNMAGSVSILLHINSAGYYYSDDRQSIGIPVLIVEIQNDITVREFENFAQFRLMSEKVSDVEADMNDTRLRNRLMIEGRDSFQPLLFKLANAAIHDLHKIGR